MWCNHAELTVKFIEADIILLHFILGSLQHMWQFQNLLERGRIVWSNLSNQYFMWNREYHWNISKPPKCQWLTINMIFPISSICTWLWYLVRVTSACSYCYKVKHLMYYFFTLCVLLRRYSLLSALWKSEKRYEKYCIHVDLLYNLHCTCI